MYIPQIPVENISVATQSKKELFARGTAVQPCSVHEFLVLQLTLLGKMQIQFFHFKTLVRFSFHQDANTNQIAMSKPARRRGCKRKHATSDDDSSGGDSSASMKSFVCDDDCLDDDQARCFQKLFGISNVFKLSLLSPSP